MSDEVSPDSLIGGKLCHGRQYEVVKGSCNQLDTDCNCVSPACGCTVTSGPGPGHLPMAASSSMTTEHEHSEFVVKKGKDGPDRQNLVKMVNNPSVRSPTYKISRELFQIPHKMTEINKLSAATKQLCMYLKYHEMQGQRQMISGDFTELPGWVNYWIRSGVSPLILLAGCVYPQGKGDPTLSDPNFIYPTIDGLRNMCDGTWGRISIENSVLGGTAVDFVAKCNTTIVGEHNLLTKCMFNNNVEDMRGFTLEWIRLFWNRFSEVIRDPALGPSTSTTLEQLLDRNQMITRSMLSNVIFDRCRETCWYVVQGHISPVETMLTQLSTNPMTFDQMRPRLAVWMHSRDALRRCGRILGTAMRRKEYSLKDVILMLGRRKECEDGDIADQVCLAYGHTVTRCCMVYTFLMGMELWMWTKCISWLDQDTALSLMKRWCRSEFF